MTAEAKRLSLRSGILVGLSLAYFFVFPEDLSTIVGLTEQLSKVVRVIVELTTAIAPGLYAVAAAGVLGWSATTVTKQILNARAAQIAGTTTTAAAQPAPPTNP